MTLTEKFQEQIPNPRQVGKFIERKGSDNKFGFLMPNNWVFHDQVVEKVLEGDYVNIKPYCAEFITTMNCSNRCGMCGYKLTKELEGVWIRNNFTDSDVHMQDIRFAKSLLDKLIDGGVKGFIFTGGGEPALFSGIEELISYATERGVDSVLYTNGNAISEKRVRKLIETSPLLVRVSLNDGNKQGYKDFHNPLNLEGALERALKTIELLAQGSLQNPVMDVGIAVVINEINRGHLVETALRIKEIVEKTRGGISFITYRPAFNYYEKEQLSSELLDETYENVENNVRAMLKGIEIRVSNITCRYEALKYDTRTYDECRSTGLFAELAPSGNLHLCCDRNCNRKYIIGDLKTQNLEEIWESKLRREMIDFVNSISCSVCPPGCKSHEINKQFEDVERLRKSNAISLVKSWIEEQRKMPKPKMVNF